MSTNTPEKPSFHTLLWIAAVLVISLLLILLIWWYFEIRLSSIDQKLN